MHYLIKDTEFKKNIEFFQDGKKNSQKQYC